MNRPRTPEDLARILGDAARLGVLAGVGLHERGPEPGFDRLARLAGKFLGVPVAVVALVDADRQYLKGCVGLSEPWSSGGEASLPEFLCKLVVDGGEPLVIDDARVDPRVEGGRAASDAGVAAYLGIPIALDGRVIGSFCAIDARPRAWTPDEVATMGDLAQSVVAEVLLRAEHDAAVVALARLEITLASIGDGVITADARGMVAYLNPVAEALTGWTTAEAAGRPMAEVFRIVDEVTRETVPNPVEKVLERGEIVGLANHTTLIARDGAEQSIDDSAAPIRLADGTLSGCILVFRDVTERRQQEIRLDEAKILLESMLAAGDVGTWTWDLAKGEIVADETLAEMFGMAVGRPHRGALSEYLDRIHPDDHAEIERRLNRAIEADDEYSAEYRLIRPDGEVRWMVARGRVRRDEDGRAVQFPGIVVDITGQKHLQDQLRDAKTRLDHLLSTGSVATWTWDVAADRIVADPIVAEWFSLSPEEAREGRLDTFTRSIHPDDRGRVARAVESATADGSSYDQEYRVVGSDGAIRWIVARGSVERDAGGRATTLSGVIIDTTDLRRAESVIREKEVFQRLIFESVRDFSIFTTDLDGIITSWNAGAENVFGYGEGEAIGRPAEIVFTPEDRADGVPLREIRIAAEAGQVGDERWHMRKDGGRFFASGMVRPMTDDAGELIGFTKVARDITAVQQAQARLREREERVRSLFNSMDQGYCIIQLRYDDDGRPDDYQFLLCNAAFETITRIGDPTGRWASDVLPGLDRTWHETYSRVALTGEPESFEMFEESMEGRSFTAYAFRTGQPGERKVAVLFSDITDRIRDQAERDRLVDQLTDADRRKDEFLAMLAHELRNPLGAISSGVQLVQTVQKPELLGELRVMIQHQVEHLTHLIDDLLDVSRITQGKVELRRQTIELTAITRKAAELAQPQVDEKRHELNVSTPSRAVAFVADPTRVEQMLSNLLTNAAKYSEPGRSIDLSAKVEGGDVVFRVRDQGYGISAEMLPKIFGLFTQVDATLDRSRGGLGIGLTLVRSLAEMHGGRVSAASDGRDRGSEFTLRLPIGEPAADPGPPGPAPPAESAPGPGVGPEVGGRRILIIDDNRDSARMTSQILAYRGYSMMTAFDGPEGVEAAKAFRPDVILLDIGLPGMNGYDVAAAIRDHDCCRLSVLVAVSGYGEAAARDRSKAAGIDHHLTKPLEFDRLDAILVASRDRSGN